MNDIARARAKRDQKTVAQRAQADAAYERRELAEAHGQLNNLLRAPLSDRKEAQNSFFETMRDNPELVAERIGWLLNGTYGYGQMKIAKQVLASPRMNRAATLTQLIGAFEWMCPENMSRAAWKKLTPGEQSRLDGAVQEALRDAAREEES